MKKQAIRLLACLVAAVMLLSAAACSEEEEGTTEPLQEPSHTEHETADYAMKIGDYTVSKETYTAMLYTVFYECYYQSGLCQYEFYGMDPWCQTFSYLDEENKSVELPLKQYMVQITKDSFVRDAAVRSMMTECGVTAQKELEELRQELSAYDESEMLLYGFGAEAYAEASAVRNIYEETLFYELYAVDGPKGVTKEAVDAYYRENAVKFYSVIHQKDTVTQEERKKLFALCEQCDQTTDVSSLFEEEAQTLYREQGDEALFKAVELLSVGQASPVEYADEDETEYLALLVRQPLDEPDESAFNNCLYYMYFDEFDADVKALQSSLKVEYNNAMLKEIDPRDFLDVEKEQDPVIYEGELRIVDDEGTVWITCEDILHAQASLQATDNGEAVPTVTLTLTDIGAAKMEQATLENLGKPLSIYIGELLITAPTVNAVISNGEVVISGLSDYEDAKNLAEQIRPSIG